MVPQLNGGCLCQAVRSLFKTIAGRIWSGSMVPFQASQSTFSRSKTSFSRSLRLARSRGSLTTSNRNSLPAIRRYFQLPSRMARCPAAL